MRIEIPITQEQKYILRTTCGFNGLPLTFSQSDLDRSEIDERKISESDFPDWKRSFLKRKQELDRLNEENSRKLSSFYSERKNLYDSCSVGKNRGEAAFAFRKALPEKELRELEGLFKENLDIFREQERNFWKEHRKYKIQSSKLLGIIGLAEGIMDARTAEIFVPEFYNLRIIPRENLQAAHASVSSGVFTKELNPQDLDILRYIHEKSSFHNGKTHAPSFPVIQVALDMDLSDMPSVQDSFSRLSGLLCHIYLPRDLADAYRKETVAEYNDKWFIPRARQALIKEVLRR
ncbi:MAG: hypothetical protein Q7R87_03150 [Nanoarchaeota archaeon]|nr:hypothetical protein [Nanoarchaeota archaeon]